MKLCGIFSILTLVCIGCSPPAFISVVDNDVAPAEIDSPSLQKKIEQTLEAGSSARELSSSRNAAWQIMHGVVCYGRELQIVTPDRGQIGALDYAFSNGLINGFELMPGVEPLPSTGRVGVKARLVPGSYVGQGHVDQWVAILAMADIPLTQEFMLGDRKFTVEDLARQAQYDVTRNPLDEYSWTLIAMTHYFPEEPSWSAADNLEVSWELLVEQELLQDIDLSPCGGTHRLAGIARALSAKKRLGLPDSATWRRAEALIQNLVEEAKESRGADGRLSSFYFLDAGRTVDLTAELSSTGHLFEFIALAVPEEQLGDPWIESSAVRLCDLLEHTAAFDLDCGALYHALNGLKIYRARRFGSPPE